MRKSFALLSTLVGLFASSYLTWAYTSSTHRMICLGTGCDEVRASKYAHLLGVPLPIYGLVFYLFIAGLILVESRLPVERSARMWRLIMLLTGGGVLFSAWLTSLEAFVIHAWCEWCVTQAIAVTLTFLAALTMMRWPQRESRPAWRKQLVLLVIAVAVGAPALWLTIRRESRQDQAPVAAVPADSAVMIRPDSYRTGAENPTLTIVEFADFQCPSCGVAERTSRVLRRRYADRVRFVFRQFPLEKIHPYAFEAAKASECGGRQNKFWPMAEMLYDNQSDLSAPALPKYAAQVGLDAAQFSACMNDPATGARVRRDLADGNALAVRATPTFFLPGKKIEGGLTEADIEAALPAGTPAAPQARKEPPPAAAGTKTVPAPVIKKEEGKKAATQPPSEPAAGKTVAGSPVGLAQGGSQPANPFAPASQPSVLVPCGVDEVPVQDPPLIHVAETRKLLEDHAAVFVDVRGDSAFREGHLPSARSITLAQLEKATPPGLQKSQAIVLYEAGGADESCATSRTAGRMLMQQGFKDVKVFKEGLEGWKKAGLPVAK